jgi:hypothetical protein
MRKLFITLGLVNLTLAACFAAPACLFSGTVFSVVGLLGGQDDGCED